MPAAEWLRAVERGHDDQGAGCHGVAARAGEERLRIETSLRANRAVL
jgi:hypothetical protein